MAETAVAEEAPASPPRLDHVPLLVVEGGPGRLSRESLVELWHFREVYSAFVVRQIKVRYKQAAIGIGWSIAQPVLSALLFSLFLGKLAHVSSEHAPYLLFVLAGTTAWTYFSGGATAAMESLISDQVLLRKVYFPREVLPFASATASLVDLLPGLACLSVAAALYGIYPSPVWLLLPVPILLLLMTSAALGLTVSSLNVYYRDVRYALPFLLQLGLFASPVIYSLSVVPGRWRTLYAIFNPVAASIDAFRRIVIHQTTPLLGQTLGAFGFTTVALTASYFLFKRLERGFADRV
jgi:lipopolysaccharide transport system permease protein